jgi:hypothetical protein
VHASQIRSSRSIEVCSTHLFLSQLQAVVIPNDDIEFEMLDKPMKFDISLLTTGKLISYLNGSMLAAI